MGRHRRSGQRSLFSIAGWLFADLLLALAVIFISANTIGAKPPVLARLTPTPVPTATPVPIATPVLELRYLRLSLPVDPDGLLAGKPAATKQLKDEVKHQSKLQGRSAGLVIVYGGAPTVGMIPRAEDIARKVMSVLRSLGRDDQFVFFQTSYYDPLYLFGGPDTTAVIDVYLFSQ